MDHFITESYFNWLKSETFTLKTEQRHYEGVLRVLHDIPFTWLIYADDNRGGDALSFRQNEFLDFLPRGRDTDLVKLGQWATSSPSVLEVMLGCARRWAYFYGNPSVPYFFGHLFRNMGFHAFPGRALDENYQNLVRHMVDVWLLRQFQSNGVGSPFPLTNPDRDQRSVDMWGQMNAYSAEHFQ